MQITRKHTFRINDMNLITVLNECIIGHKRRMKKVCLEVPASLGDGCVIEARNVGAYFSVGNNSIIKRTAKIGRYTTIGAFCNIGATSVEHNIYFSNSVVFQKGELPWCALKIKMDENNKIETKLREDIEIGNDVWIGDNVIVLEGSLIGDGCIILPGTVVKGNVEPYSIVEGNPAKVIGKRFDEEIIRKMQEIKWWEYSEKNLNFIQKNTDNILQIFDEILNIKDKQKFTPVRLEFNSAVNEITLCGKENLLLYKI